MKNFVDKNTNPSQIRGNRQGAFGRNPIETMNRWKYTLLYSEVQKVQDVCVDALQLWKYKEVESETDLPDFNFIQDLHAFDL